MSIYRKKSAVINSQVRIRNELSQIFVPTNNNLGISINTTTVPVNSTNTILTQYASSDIITANSIGKNWQRPLSGVYSNTLISVCWSSELGIFVHITLSYSSISRDGLNWTRNPSNFAGGTLRSICWSPELRKFCCVGRSNTYNIFLSSDGHNWYAQNPVAAQNCLLHSVCWSPELRRFCAVPIYGGKVVVSSDGTNWTSSSSGVYDNSWNSVCWSPELRRFCAVATSVTGTTNQYVMVSNDGLTWTNAVSGVLPNAWYSVCWSPKLGLFCAVASSGTSNQRVMVSSDGFNWRNAISNVVENTWESVCWSSDLGLFCAVASIGYYFGVPGSIMVSSDGLNWSIATNAPYQSGTFHCVCWSPELNMFCAVGEGGSNTDRMVITDTSLSFTNKNYYLALVSSNGTQEIKTKSNISYNINNNTLQLENLSTTNLPTCSAIPTKSTDLINRAYLNNFVGDYTQGWIHEDWLNGDPSGNTKVFSWGHSYNYSGTNLTSSNITVIPSEAGRQGIIRLTRATSSYTILRPNPSIQFSSTQNVSARFLVRPFSNSSSTAYTQIRLFLSPFRGNADYYNIPANYANMACWVFETYAVNTNTDNIKWGCMVNTNVANAFYNYGSSGNSLRNKWVLFEIELNNQKPSFYITVVGETNRTLVYQEPTNIIDSSVMLVPYIGVFAGSVASTTSVDVDYIDIKYNNMSRT